MDSVISIENMSFSYNGKNKVLENINFNATGNECIGLIGANGAGKSTLLKILTGIESAYEGKVKINGLDVNKKNIKSIRKDIGYVFQDSESQLFMTTVYEDVAFGPRNYGYDKEKVDILVKNALKQVHLENFENRQIYKLSGGEKKLAAIATILSMEPKVILMDEPTVALDPRNRRNLIDVINGMKGLKIIASHDLDMILDTCKRTVLVSGQTVIKDGDTMEILKDEKLLKENGLELPLSMSRHYD